MAGRDLSGRRRANGKRWTKGTSAKAHKAKADKAFATGGTSKKSANFGKKPSSDVPF